MARKHQGPKDFAETAFDAFQEAVGEAPPDEKPSKDLKAVSAGRKGGLKGGQARADKLTPEQRREIAKKAAAARWKKG